jgi:hypothetical protein
VPAVDAGFVRESTAVNTKSNLAAILEQHGIKQVRSL